MINYMVKSSSGSGRICFTNPAKSGSGRISQKQIRYSPTIKVKAVDFYSASSCTPKAGGQAGGLAVKPPLMRSRHGPEPLATQATAHRLHTQAWVATRPLARQRQSAVGLHLRNPSLMDYYSFNRPRRDGRLSRPCWLTDGGRFTH